MNQEPRTKNQEVRGLIKKIKNKFLVLSTKFKVELGFSLIELLVFVSLIGIIGAITTQVLIISIRSQGKSEIGKEVKQSGDYAMSVMDTMIRNASDITDYCNENVDEINILNQDGYNTRLYCDVSASQIASESSGFPGPTLTQSLTSEKVAVSSCVFRIVCPTPPLSPKYVFINYTISQVGTGLPPDQTATVNYQSTVSLRNYE